ncbi:hypothetical protein GC096_20605 [Paenibacillus sp. LMG 31461]|uniref:Uncharacterized protein n=1 Tax=Paenibacillus plantarum TaxID=2654975 RepID=A0ABX1XD96_9BACL|nr:hypothetical protein [Paenibacillus plantarum]
MPTLKDSGKLGKSYTKVPLGKNFGPTQTLRRLTILWVDNAGVPFVTSGFFCEARTLNGTRLATARFDAFGTAVFRTIGTPTSRTLVLRTFDEDGVIFRTRTVRSGISAFVFIG